MSFCTIQYWQFCHSCLKAQIFSSERQGQIGLKGNSLCRGLMERGCDRQTIKRHFTLKFHWIFSGVCSCVKCCYRNTGSVPRYLFSPYVASQSIPSLSGTCRQPGPFPHLRSTTWWPVIGQCLVTLGLWWPCLVKGRCKWRKKMSKTPAPHWAMALFFTMEKIKRLLYLSAATVPTTWANLSDVQ